MANMNCPCCKKDLFVCEQKEITDLIGYIDKLKFSLEELYCELENKNNELENKNNELENKNNIISELNNKINELNNKIKNKRIIKKILIC